MNRACFSMKSGDKNNMIGSPKGNDSMTTLEKLKKRKELQNKYSNLRQLRSAKMPKDKNSSDTKRRKNQSRASGFGMYDKETQTQTASTFTTEGSSSSTSFGKIYEMEQHIHDIKNEYEVKESHLKLEISMLKAKLDEQIQINLGTKKIVGLEHKSLNLLINKIDTYLINEDVLDLEDTEKSLLFGDTQDSELNESPLFEGRKRSVGGSKELDSSFAKIKQKVEVILKINKKLKQELSLKNAVELNTALQDVTTAQVVNLNKSREEINSAYSSVPEIQIASQDISTRNQISSPIPKGKSTSQIKNVEIKSSYASNLNVNDYQDTHLYRSPVTQSNSSQKIWSMNKAKADNIIQTITPTVEVVKHADDFVEVHSNRGGGGNGPRRTISQRDDQSLFESDLHLNFWQDDSEAKACLICKQEFWFFSRKHHCRM